MSSEQKPSGKARLIRQGIKRIVGVESKRMDVDMHRLELKARDLLASTKYKDQFLAHLGLAIACFAGLVSARPEQTWLQMGWFGAMCIFIALTIQAGISAHKYKNIDVQWFIREIIGDDEENSDIQDTP